MLLKDLAYKYSFGPDELLEILKLENYPVNSIEDEVDATFIEYFLEQTYGEELKKRKIFRGKQAPIGFQAKGKSKGKSGGKKGHYDNNKNKKKTEEVKIDPFLEKISMSIGEAARQAQLPVSTVIMFFLNNKKLYSINSLLNEAEVELVAKEFSIPLKVADVIKDNVVEKVKIDINNKNLVRRPPVIVVVGHVDHGKTTLLDTIRRCAVAKSEKGGITQHLGAYVVKKNNSDLVFIDTPGHAAFTMLRSRGVSIADIAILVVAADDGVMPQTVESIKMLKAAKSAVIVALTKIDKSENTDYTRVYKQLSEHDILVEEWGGEVPVVPVSAVKERGINELLDMIVLNADLLDLKTDVTVKPVGYVIEARIDKGLGPIATVILHKGTIKKGDCFYVNEVSGRVASLTDSTGKQVESISPSYPFVVSGGDGLLDVGGNFVVDSFKEVKRIVEENRLKKVAAFSNGSMNTAAIAHPMNIIVKADVLSSLQALVKAIKEIKGDFFYTPVILSSSVGEVNENDVNFALQSKSAIYTFTVKCPPAIKSMADKMGVKIFSYDVIYHLIEDLLKRIEKSEEIRFVKKKTADLQVLKIFTSKAAGTIAGFRVVSGQIKQHAQIVILRNDHKIGEGTIKSLQKERNPVKELNKGHEGALILDNYTDWQEGDKVEVFMDVREQ